MHFFTSTQPCHARNLIFFAFFVLVGLVFNYCYFLNDHSLSSISTSLPKIPKLSTDNLRLPPAVTEFTWFTPKSKFWHDFAPLLDSAKPKCEPAKLRTKAVTAGAVAGSTYNPVNLLEMSDEDVAGMKRQHALFLDLLSFSDLKLDFEHGTQGIVTTAGGAYFPVLLVSLLMLRRTGSTLPVEIFLQNDEEYEKLLCEDVFPKLNAKCVLLSSYLTSSRRKFHPHGYQLKILAILFSRFEDVLFLDADDFPVHPPESLFDSTVYKESGLVLWKDFWKPTFSPLFTNITSLDPSLLSSRATIEAGQMLVNRRKKGKMLMLASYYNIYGDWYYDLISQGGPGEGDKDTFVPAALVWNESFYTVDKSPEPLGQRGNGMAVLQFSAVDAHACDLAREANTNATTTETKMGEKEAGRREEDAVCEAAPFFIHASWPPKLNALHNVRDQRQWGSLENALSLFGVDVEKVAWGDMVEMACEGELISNSTTTEQEEDRRGQGLGTGKLEFWDWGEGNKTSTGVCAQTRNCFRNMFGEEYVFTDDGLDRDKSPGPNTELER
ncbi:related to protein TTP1 [Phialocephala subalpina]|uniref:Related to protein TTP1 n=1 Tax=Phialocephala subalpina TaxID=576137 RepID=A0A1L7WUE9_9HELO|nr:related to protein TTP1 [Phialocephala subalpina]